MKEQSSKNPGMYLANCKLSNGFRYIK